MTGMRLRLKLRGIALYYYAYTWGGIDWGVTGTFGAWDLIMFKSDFTLPSETPYEPPTLIPSACLLGETTSHTEVLIGTARFIFPHIIKPVMICDGTIQGSMKFEYINGTATTGEVTKIIEEIKKMDSDGNETLLATNTITFTNWIITENRIEAYPFFFGINNKKINNNERLIHVIKHYGKVNAGTNEFGVYMYIAINTDDHSIDIPIV